jgi:hypothetical protein
MNDAILERAVSSSVGSYKAPPAGQRREGWNVAVAGGRGEDGGLYMREEGTVVSCWLAGSPTLLFFFSELCDVGIPGQAAMTRIRNSNFKQLQGKESVPARFILPFDFYTAAL